MNQLDRYLFGALVMVLLPHVGHLPLWVSLAGTLLFLERLRSWRGGRVAVHRGLLMGAAVLCLAGITVTFGSIMGREAGVSLLFLLVGLKLLEHRGRRDAMLLLFLAYFLVMTNFFYDQGLFMGLYMLVTVLVITGVLVAMNLPEPAQNPRRSLRTAGVLLLQALPLMLVLFVLFPRIPGPLWGLPKDAISARTGLSESMRPGSISNLSRSNAVAFRVAFEGPPPAKSELYWRGPVLWLSNGWEWNPGLPRSESPPPVEALEPPIAYTVFLEPTGQRWLFALDLPEFVSAGGRIQRDFEVTLPRPVDNRLRYTASSWPRYRIGGSLTGLERRMALQLPPGRHGRTLDMVRQWQEEGATPADIMNRALRYFRNQAFFYTLQPPLLTGDPVDEFLFDTRQGFCEHYASAFVIMMRAAGIPARVVTGYLGGEINDLADYMVVRQSDAHAWAEVWLDGRGWIRVDPTGMVSPERVEQGSAVALPETRGLPAFIAPDNAFFRQLRQGWDVLNGGWNFWVLGYSQERQLELMALLGLGLPSLADLGLWLVGVLAVVMAGLFLWLLRRAPERLDGLLRQYRRFRRQLIRRGFATSDREGPQDLARRLAESGPELAPGADIARLYARLRYRDGDDRAGQRELRRRVRAFGRRRW